MVMCSGRGAKPLPGEKLADFKKWLAVWQRIEIMDIYYFPLWEKGVHDVLQKHVKELTQCFLGYTRSISEDSAEDALEMSMGEFKDFVEDCGLETKAVNFAVMTNMFVKANATNTAQVHQQKMDGRRNAEGKEGEKKIGEKGGSKKEKKVAGILLESEAGGVEFPEWVIVGLGVNVAHFPDDSAYPATSLSAEHWAVSVEDTLVAFARSFQRWANIWVEEGFGIVRRTWLNRAIGKGKSIEVRLENETLTGTFKDLDDDGALILERDGAERRVAAGVVYFPDN